MTSRRFKQLALAAAMTVAMPLAVHAQEAAAGPADPLNEVSSLGWKSWHAAEILNINWVRRVLHCATLYQ